MNESDAVEKMRRLMVSMDTMAKFKNLRDRWPTVILIGLLSILASAIIFLLVDFIDYFTVTTELGFVPGIPIGTYYGGGLFSAIAWIIGIYLSYRVLNRAYRSSEKTDWEDDLKEGLLGIIKILSRYDWDKKLLDLRRSKQGFMIVTFSQLALNFIFLLAVMALPFGIFISLVLQITPNYYFLILFAFLVTLILGDKNLKKLHNRLWSADILIGEVWRFSSEFKQREL